MGFMPFLLILWFFVYKPDGATIQYIYYLNRVYFDCNTTNVKNMQDQTMPYSSWRAWKIYFYRRKFLSTRYTPDLNEQDTFYS